MSTAMRLVLLLALATGLICCGQKGPLRRPETASLAAWDATPAPLLR